MEEDFMSLIDEQMEYCTMMDKRSIPDGQGGFDYEWTEGATFDAAVTKDSSLQARIAEKQGVTEIYSITVKRGVILRVNDVVKRLSDGSIYRVTSNIKDDETPDRASFQYGQVTAEKVVTL
jgi:hypothetical protein